jgi:hypothetical protein
MPGPYPLSRPYGSQQFRQYIYFRICFTTAAMPHVFSNEGDRSAQGIISTTKNQFWRRVVKNRFL